jgi:hypothetical protein
MMCGCEVNHDSPWVPADFQVDAHISLNGQKCGDPVPLTFQFNSQFNGELAGLGSGEYVAEIIATQHSTGNHGKACVKFHVD